MEGTRKPDSPSTAAAAPHGATDKNGAGTGLDHSALSLAVPGDRKTTAWLDLAARGEAEVVTAPMVTAPVTAVEAYDGGTTEQRWGWVLSGLKATAMERTRPAGPAATWPMPSRTATSTRSTRCSPSSRESRRGRSLSAPRTGRPGEAGSESIVVKTA
ncbi:hypothetical protein [Streptomyces sp. NPDC048295]|uniref:hypothetical protein n=1 Tax=Streptomyces sp. NPDC048295 TaxID=3154617 RepID=UPI00341C26CB